MRVVVDTGMFSFHNVGDEVMLCTALQRICRLWSGAEVYVFCDEPDALKERFAHVRPIANSGRCHFFQKWNMVGPARRFAPKWCEPYLASLEMRARWCFPDMSLRWAGLRVLTGNERECAEHFIGLLRSADLVVAAGGGYLTSHFRALATLVLATLGLAVCMGKRIALVGQGIGPIDDVLLRSLARAVLPRASLISLREDSYSKPLLMQIGVPEDRLLCTGDDAVEMAYDLRPAALGHAIGINVRVTEYSGVGRNAVNELGALVKSVADRHRSPLILLPIASSSEDDCGELRRVFGDDAIEIASTTVEGRAAAVIRAVGQCRVVVTCSYHAGVFALSQGIPVIGLVASDYYNAKFCGLADQFAFGCDVIDLRHASWLNEVKEKLDQRWQHATATQEQLLARAREQIAASQAGYQLLQSLIS